MGGERYVAWIETKEHAPDLIRVGVAELKLEIDTTWSYTRTVDERVKSKRKRGRADGGGYE